MSVGTHIESDAAVYGFMKQLGVGHDHHKTRWVIKCSKCPVQFSAYWSPLTSPGLMVKNMRQRQWDVGRGDRPLCPNCAHPRADKSPTPKPPPIKWAPSPTAMGKAFNRAVQKINTPLRSDETDYTTKIAEVPPEIPGNPTVLEELHRALNGMIPRAPMQLETTGNTLNNEAPMTNVQPTTKPQPSPKITFAVFEALNNKFDATARLYKAGYTDLKIAQECSTSEHVVAYLRKETFGELAEDPRITNVRDDVELLRMELMEMVKSFDKKISALTSRVEQIATSTKWR